MQLGAEAPRLQLGDVLAELAGDVGVVAVAQAVEDVVADVDVVWAMVAIEDQNTDNKSARATVNISALNTAALAGLMSARGRRSWRVRFARW